MYLNKYTQLLYEERVIIIVYDLPFLNQYDLGRL